MLMIALHQSNGIHPKSLLCGYAMWIRTFGQWIKKLLCLYIACRMSLERWIGMNTTGVSSCWKPAHNPLCYSIFEWRACTGF